MKQNMCISCFSHCTKEYVKANIIEKEDSEERTEWIDLEMNNWIYLQLNKVNI